MAGQVIVSNDNNGATDLPNLSHDLFEKSAAIEIQPGLIDSQTRTLATAKHDRAKFGYWILLTLIFVWHERRLIEYI